MEKRLAEIKRKRKSRWRIQLTEWVDVLKSREAFKNSGELLSKSLLRIFHLSSIESLAKSTIGPSMTLRFAPLILLILKPDLICVGRRR